MKEEKGEEEKKMERGGGGRRLVHYFRVSTSIGSAAREVRR